MKKIGITDSLFIFPEHERQLRASGFTLERLDTPHATEEQLIEFLHDKAGYILGGVELVTEKVLSTLKELEVIAFCGSGFKGYIPGWVYATKKGIAITCAPGGHANAVAEWTLGAALAMNRGFLDIPRTHSEILTPTPGFEGQTIGIIGLGHTGKRIAEMLTVFRPASLLYYSLHRHPQEEQAYGLSYGDMSEVLRSSDIIFLSASPDVGKNFFGRKQFAQMKHDALLVSVLQPGIVDEDALYEALRSGKVRAASDYPMGDQFNDLPLSVWYSSPFCDAFNTHAGLRYTSDMVVRSITNVLTTGTDKYVVDPAFKDALA